MAQQTALDWLVEQVKSKDWQDMFMWHKEDVFKKAKEMENDRRREDFKIGYNQGYLDARCNHINDADNLAYERHYLQSQIDNIDAQIKAKENKIADMLITGEIKEDKNI